jgi:hypothetical protein
MLSLRDLPDSAIDDSSNDSSQPVCATLNSSLTHPKQYPDLQPNRGIFSVHVENIKYTTGTMANKTDLL